MENANLSIRCLTLPALTVPIIVQGQGSPTFPPLSGQMPEVFMRYFGTVWGGCIVPGPSLVDHMQNPFTRTFPHPSGDLSTKMFPVNISLTETR